MRALLVAVCLMMTMAVQVGANPITAEQRLVASELVQAGVARAEAAEIVKAMLQARFSEQQMHRFAKQIGAYRPDSEDVESIMSKIHEGIAKKVSPDNILGALLRVQERRQYAATLAGDAEPPYQLQLRHLYGDCLAAGLEHRHAEQIAWAIRTRTRQMGGEDRRRMNVEAVLTVREMVRRGASSQEAVDMINSAVAHNDTADSMVNLRTSLQQGSRGSTEINAGRSSRGVEKGAKGGQLDRTGPPDDREKGAGGAGGGGGPADKETSGGQKGGGGNGRDGRDGPGGRR